MTMDVSPFSKWGLSLPPDTAIPNPLLESCSLEGREGKQVASGFITAFNKGRGTNQRHLRSRELTMTNEKQKQAPAWLADRSIKGNALSQRNSLWKLNKTKSRAWS